MRKTGSRDPRESLEASATSPFSIAVNTFSIRFGSRRNQRPPHQKIRSITTVSPMIDTIKIGHIIGPPLRNLSINQLLPSTPPLVFSSAVGEGLGAVAGAGLKVALIVAPGAAGEVAAPGGAGAAGPPGGALAAGSCAGAAGFARAPGLTAGAGAPGGGPAGDVCGGAGRAGDCAREVNARADEHRQVLSNIFIIEESLGGRLDCGTSFPLSQTVYL